MSVGGVNLCAIRQSLYAKSPLTLGEDGYCRCSQCLYNKDISVG